MVKCCQTAEGSQSDLNGLWSLLDHYVGQYLPVRPVVLGFKSP
jgi:hypothetical protein